MGGVSGDSTIGVVPDAAQGAIADLALAVALEPYDVATTLYRCSSGESGVLDYVGLGLPLVPALGKIDDVADAWRHATKIDDTTDVGRLATSADDGAQAVYTVGSFRRNLQKLTGMTDEQIRGPQAHHVFPQELEGQFEAIPGLNIHDPRYGAWVDATSHPRWSRAYNAEQASWLGANERPSL